MLGWRWVDDVADLVLETNAEDTDTADANTIVDKSFIGLLSVATSGLAVSSDDMPSALTDSD